MVCFFRTHLETNQHISKELSGAKIARICNRCYRQSDDLFSILGGNRLIYLVKFVIWGNRKQ